MVSVADIRTTYDSCVKNQQCNSLGRAHAHGLPQQLYLQLANLSFVMDWTKLTMTDKLCGRLPMDGTHRWYPQMVPTDGTHRGYPQMVPTDGMQGS